MPVLTTLGAATAKAWGFLQQVAAAADPYFNYVTMLLTGNGTNGAQNNTFLDSSSNAFSITRNGNTTQGSFSPYGSLWSNYFNGSSYLGYTNNTGMSFGTGDFTVEAWVNFNSVSTGQQCIITGGYASNTGWNMQFRTDQSTNPCIYFAAGDSNSYTSSQISPTAGSWNHFAVSRSGNTLYFFFNGVAAGTASVTGISFDKNSATTLIGGLTTGGVAPLTGYVSNARVLKGTALYTSAFTPSTTPLTAITNTQLLTCQSNRFIDNSSNAYALTVGGTPSVQRFSPFNPTASYDTATIGGSGYFDGSGDYLTLPQNSAFQFTGDHCIEAWVYWTVSQASIIYATGNASSTDQLGLFPGGEGIWWGGQPNSSTVPTLNSWNHVCATRSGSQIRIFLNGTLVGTVTNGSTIGSGSSTPYLGCRPSGGVDFNGYMGAIRITNGSIPTSYQTSTTTNGTAVFTPPTSPFTTSSQGATAADVKFLANYTNAGIPDSAMMNDLETLGDAQVSTSVSKFGNGSLSGVGGGNKLIANSPTKSYTTTGDFTFETFLYLAEVNYGGTLFSQYGSAPNRGLNIGVTSGNKLSFSYSTDGSDETSTVSSATLSVTTWYHIAVTRSSGTVRLFINGVLDTTLSASSIYVPNVPMSILNNTNANSRLRGYMDDVRITTGYARYTSTFTPPSAALPTY